jgi:hypothetical protein
MDYLRTDPEAPPGYNNILVKAESYINRRLSKANEPFRYDAKKRIFSDRKKLANKRPVLTIAALTVSAVT